MKKITVIMLSIVMAFLLAACGNPGAETIPEAPPAQTTSEKQVESNDSADANSSIEDTKHSEPEKPKEVAYTINNEIIVDNEYCTVTLVSGTAKKNGDVDFKFILENKTEDKNMMFSIDDTAVNGWIISSLFAESVAGGKKSNEFLSFSSSDLEVCDISRVDKLEFYLRVYDNDDWMADEYAEGTFTVYPTGLTEEEIVSPQRPIGIDEMTVVDDENCSFVILGTYEDSIWGYTVVACLENKTDNKGMMFSWEDVSVNGYMIDPFWATSLSAGNKKITTISFSSSQLEENDIESVEEIEFELRVYDNENWSAKDFVKDIFTYKPEKKD